MVFLEICLLFKKIIYDFNLFPVTVLLFISIQLRKDRLIKNGRYGPEKLAFRYLFTVSPVSTTVLNTLDT